MNYRKLLNSYKRFVFGNNFFPEFERRIFLLVMHIAVLIALFGVFVDIALGFPPELILATLAAFFVLLFFHIKARNSKSFRVYIVVFFIVAVLVVCALWFLNSGYDGNTTLLLFMLFIVVLTVLPKSMRLTAYITFSVTGAVLMAVQHFYPQSIVSYYSQEQRFLDLLIGLLVYLAFAYKIHSAMLRNFSFEQEKVKLRNKQLGNLNKKLNEKNKQYEESLAKVNELNMSKDRFIAVLSHDLRSPYQGIMGMAKLLQNDYDELSDKEKKQCLRNLNQSLDKHYQFMEELLLWGRMQRNTVSLYIEEVNVRELLMNAVSVFTNNASEKKIKLELQCGNLLTAHMDRDLMSVVIRNLISNAIKFSQVGSIIKIEAVRMIVGVQISVADSGVGILEEDLERLFKMDESFSTTGTGGESGSGLGLMLCSEILKKHNGSIMVQSKEGKGSVFMIQIPDKL